MVVGGGEEAWDVGNGFGEEDEKGKTIFSKATRKIRLATFKCFLLSGKEASRTHQKS